MAGPKSPLTHRIAYLLASGSIPDDKYIRHLCDNRRCAQPDHLTVGTHAQNQRDIGASRRIRRSVEEHGGTISEVIAGRICRAELEAVDE